MKLKIKNNLWFIRRCRFTVTAYLLSKAVNKNLYCIFVDHGLLRKNEANEVSKYFPKIWKNFLKSMLLIFF